ncbi:MBL fold metallo-hydrolase [Peristeroidobacter agariperforans]|uniref:MBL fold metallo-hydrolase n=1 Tax=Peristeroidobacter agariperforans TaxID=268404 RepID=UPI001300A153|nr:MBL fold metallo-hydrolase [Peristeroidobacter agariperforans]
MSSSRLLAGLLAGLMSVAALASGPDSVRSSALADNGLKKEDFPRWQQVGSDAYIFEGVHSPDPNGTLFTTVSLVVITKEGVLVVDGQGNVPESQQLIDQIKKVTSQPVKYVVVGSDHGDHTGGNAAFTSAYPDAVFVSTAFSKEALARSKNAAVPTRLVKDRETIELGGTQIQVLNLGRAHTGGDLVVYLPASKVLFMSEVYLRGLFPAMRSAYPSEWLATIDKALAMDVSLYIPGHGFTDEGAAMKRDLVEFKKAVQYVIGESKRLHAAGLKCESAKNCPAIEQANWGPYKKWPASGSQGPLAVAKVYQELEGKLP